MGLYQIHLQKPKDAITRGEPQKRSLACNFLRTDKTVAGKEIGVGS